jgi:4-amino-4-deoxychorismate lyase
MYLIDGLKLCPLNSLPPERLMRGLLYGDGLFESIYYHSQTAFFYDEHVQRLTRGMKILGLQASVPSIDDVQVFLKTLQKDQDTLRIRLMVIREPGGLYTPTNDKAMVLLHMESTPEFSILNDVASGISVQSQLVPNALSFCKTLNAIPYIMAGRERAAKGWGEILMTEGRNNELAAAGSGNLIAFHPINKEFTMPGEHAGVAAGIMRAALAKYLIAEGYKVSDEAIRAQNLAAMQMASCNSFSVKYISTIDSIPHNTAEISVIINNALSLLKLA